MASFNWGHIILVGALGFALGSLIGWGAAAATVIMPFKQLTNDFAKLTTFLSQQQSKLYSTLSKQLTIISKRLDERQIERDLAESRTRLAQIWDILGIDAEKTAAMQALQTHSDPNDVWQPNDNLSSDQDNQS